MKKISATARSGRRRTGGISGSNRRRLETLHRRAEGPFGIAEAASVLGISIERARRLLRYLAQQGWLARVRRGLYVAVPLEARTSGEWQEDPWVVAERTFNPGYIGGWSACEHWGLTDQLFRDIVVFTARRVRRRRVELQGTPIRVKVISEGKLFGTRRVWRNQVPVQVSDASRTIVDILDEPAVGGGIRHVAEAVREYFGGDHRDDGQLVEYAVQLGNRTVFKRLGYLLEALGIEAPELVQVCQRRLSSGVSSLDPSIPAKGRISSRWNLRVNADLGQEVSA